MRVSFAETTRPADPFVTAVLIFIFLITAPSVLPNRASYHTIGALFPSKVPLYAVLCPIKPSDSETDSLIFSMLMDSAITFAFASGCPPSTICAKVIKSFSFSMQYTPSSSVSISYSHNTHIYTSSFGIVNL